MHNYKITAKLVFDLERPYGDDSISTIFHNGLDYCYSYLNKHNGDKFNVKDLIEETKKRIYEKESSEIYIKNDGYFTLFNVYNNLLTAIPVEPFKYKYAIDKKHHIDLAFYVLQMINLCDNVQIKQIYTQLVLV